MTELEQKLKAAQNPDWQQVVLNGGPPCFHLQGNRFCLRAENWFGHLKWRGIAEDHEFVSLEDFIKLLPCGNPMTKILCDQCGQDAQTPERTAVKHLACVFGYSDAKDWDFCSSECFWKWVEEKKPKMDHSTVKHDFITCANCDGMGCLVCEGKGGFGVNVE